MRNLIDRLIGVIGILTSITMFLTQDKLETKKILFALSPLIASFFIIVAIGVFRKISIKFKSLIIASNHLKRINATRCITSMTVRILNEKGDISCKKTYIYKLINDLKIDRTIGDAIYSAYKIPNNTFDAIVNDSNIKNIKLIKHFSDKPKDLTDGKEYFHYKWDFSIDPPLQKKGDFIEYEYEITIPKCESSAFCDKGSSFFYVSATELTETTCYLISPRMYKIEIIDFFIIEPDEKKIKGTSKFKPDLSLNKQILTWKIPLRPNAKYVVKYKLIKTITNK